MRLYLETLVDQGDSDPSIKARCMNVLAGEVRRLERIVSDMLSVSEIEAGSLKISRDDVAPRGIFEEIESDFRALAEDKEITLQFELPPKFLTLQADRDKLTLLLHNLVGNALKYTPSGGMVKVVVEQTPEQLSVQVVDNGIGIRQEELELIFDRFYRAKDRRISSITGSGLGLALARQVARLHGGDIQAQSTIDKGSTFTFVIPNMPATAVVSKAA
jgi:signal transduction histidine kinase